jgi:hypothetical protein
MIVLEFIGIYWKVGEGGEVGEGILKSPRGEENENVLKKASPTSPTSPKP